MHVAELGSEKKRGKMKIVSQITLKRIRCNTGRMWHTIFLTEAPFETLKL